MYVEKQDRMRERHDEPKRHLTAVCAVICVQPITFAPCKGLSPSARRRKAIKPGISMERISVKMRRRMKNMEHHSLVFNSTRSLSAAVATGSNQDRFSFLSRKFREPQLPWLVLLLLSGETHSLALYLTSRGVRGNNQHH